MNGEALLAAAIVAMVLLGGCIEQHCTQGSGVPATEDRTVSSFSSIELEGFGDLYLAQGPQQPLRLQGDDNILPLSKTDVRGSSLRIYTDGCIRATEPLNIYVTAGQIKSLEASGISTILGRSKITSQALDIRASGAGAVDLDVDCTDLFADISGAGSAVLRGKADRSNIHCSGSGGIDASGLSTNRTKVEISGSGQAEVNAQSELDVRISGSGSVHYTGTPEKITQEISGSGRLQRGSTPSLPWRKDGY